MRIFMFFIALLCFVTAGYSLSGSSGSIEPTGIFALIVGIFALRFAFRGKKSLRLRSISQPATKSSTNSIRNSLNELSKTSIPLTGK